MLFTPTVHTTDSAMPPSLANSRPPASSRSYLPHPGQAAFLPFSKTLVRFDAANAIESLHPVLTWPKELLQVVTEWGADKPISESAKQMLAEFDLMNAASRPTPLGHKVRYHVAEKHWQTGRPALDGHFPLEKIQPLERVLDVGCGAGQTLRLLGTKPQVELVGVDCDLDSLALGARFAREENLSVTFVEASAHALPFAPETFDLVMTRVAINFMHQRTAFAEMVRVLRPGGILFCRFERIWHDAFSLAEFQSPWRFACKFRDLAFGVIHSYTGWQPTPGTTLHGGRAFASASRVRKILTRQHCEIVDSVPSKFGPIFWGNRTQYVILAKKM